MARRASPAFTLVELLVVIAIIALLVSMLLPALANAKKLARMIREQAAMQQTGVAMSTYTSDNKDKVLPSGPHWDWVHVYGRPTARNKMLPTDYRNVGLIHEGSACKTWVFHLLYWGNLKTEALQLDSMTWGDFDRRDATPLLSEAGVVDYTGRPTGWHAAFAMHPSFGMNGVFVGGSYSHGAFRAPPDPNIGVTTGINPRTSGGTFYIENFSKVRQASRLLMFASARGGDVKNATAPYWGYCANDPNGSPVVPGYWLVTPPKPHPRGRAGNGATFTLGGGWVNNNDSYSDSMQPSTWGMLQGRHFKKVVTGMCDGHVEVEEVRDLRDMRRWSNYASDPNWTFVTAP